jgi:hypothetical protein
LSNTIDYMNIFVLFIKYFILFDHVFSRWFIKEIISMIDIKYPKMSCFKGLQSKAFTGFTEDDTFKKNIIFINIVL